MGYLFAANFENRMALLAASAPGICQVKPMAEPTLSEQLDLTTFSTSYSYLSIAKGAGSGRRTVLIVAGQHAREWAQPDAALEFAEELIQVYNAKTDFIIPKYTSRAGSDSAGLIIPADEIKRIVEKLTILIVPLANPDGRDFSITTDNNWRKNRAPREIAVDTRTAGVDLNRNHPFAWKYEDFYTPTALTDVDLHTSRFPHRDTYRGPAVPAPTSSPPATGPLSQPEVRNLHAILDLHQVTWCIDLHSRAGEIYYPWGTEANGTNPAKSFQNGAHHDWDGPTHGTYSEYMPRLLRARLKAVADSMAANIKLATGRNYTVGSSAVVSYAAPGTLSDSFFSRQFPPAGGKNLLSFEAEFGFKESIDTDDGFQPLNDPADPNNHAHGYEKIRREIWAAVITFLQEAAKP